MSTLRSALGNIFPSDRILDSRLLREIYGRDASYFNIIPQAIVRPESASEVQQLLTLARSQGFGVTFRTGGTSLSGQTVGSGVVCELRNALHRHEIRDGEIEFGLSPLSQPHKLMHILSHTNARLVLTLHQAAPQ